MRMGGDPRWERYRSPQKDAELEVSSVYLTVILHFEVIETLLLLTGAR